MAKAPEFSAQRNGLVLTGGLEVTQMLQQWGALQVYVNSFVSSAVAQSVFISSQKRVPYDTGELFDSGYWGHVEGLEAKGISQQLTVPIAGNVEGTPDYAAVIPDLTSGFMMPTRFGQRAFSKYAVGYTADHAAVVHENPHSAQFVQPPTSASGYSMPYPDHKKEDHFLLKAYEEHIDYFSGAMRYGIEQTLNKLKQRVTQRAAVTQPRALGGALGAPRLVKR